MRAKYLCHLLGGLLLTIILPLAPAQAALVTFTGQGTGPLLLVPESDTVVRETFDLAYTPDTGFPFDRLFIADAIDLNATGADDLLFDTYFELTAVDGSGLYGTFDLIAGGFETETREVFIGRFFATRGTGAFAGYTGSGTFSGINDYFSDFEAVSTMAIVGVARIPAPGTLLLLGIGATVLLAAGSRRSAT